MCATDSSKSVFGKRFIVASFACLSISATAVSVTGTTSTQHYLIRINGPTAELSYSCEDPCKLDRKVEVNSNVSQSTQNSAPSKLSELSIRENKGTVMTGSRIKTTDLDTMAGRGIKCIGECFAITQTSQLTFNSLRKLHEGITVSISDGYARFAFYSVVNTENGPATRTQFSEFRIDRPLIELELYGHEVEIRTTATEP